MTDYEFECFVDKLELYDIKILDYQKSILKQVFLEIYRKGKNDSK